MARKDRLKNRKELSRTRVSYASSQRVAGESGVVIKDWGGRLPLAVAYPNSYYVGMSNLGLHTLYRLINNYPEYLAERFFWEGGTAKGRPTLSVESRRPLTDYVALLFTLSYELDFLNIPSMLADCGMPLYARERDEAFPLVIGGGACIMSNPSPAADFFDVFCIGEAEAILPELLAVLSETAGESKGLILERLAKIPGLYVPSIPPEQPVERVFPSELTQGVGTAVFSTATELGEMYLMEVERGCGHQCRFCLVAGVFCPLRYHPLELLLKQAEEGMLKRKRIGLVGPVVSDHPQVTELVSRLRNMDFGLSVSSLRIKPLSEKMLDELALSGVSSLAMAPEAGSERLRRIIRKGITEDDIIRAAALVAEKGFRQLKFYFMLGLPGEADEDVEEMIVLAEKAQQAMSSKGRGVRLSLNIAPFVPKPATPFQWLGMEDAVLIKRRLDIIRLRLEGQGIEVRAESPEMSQIQAVLSRGDSSLSNLLATAGGDSLACWKRATKSLEIDSQSLAKTRFDLADELPWHMLENPKQRQKLETEYKTAFKEI
ncbi:radical SAM protein [Dehalococcoides mccartyi]|uniref:Radical SAM protein n=1 Tax=Dehalococcoides mccartyi TaxID=61435 RepID=A0A2J1DY36_9CHLR|nr:radical SAM protein [Dehalococcoides mccartyi]AGG07430.1 radical SAM domain-containing protein [Dehalococcoides mccartyi BTF08]AQW62001.1 radical SAM protein [Dehalococcoides mccartyi]KSV16635.1 radical SAM protein [Dehalococcoides mccartyi]PKH47041.1 radical SAM protein [Dehalococcoides mccartyi]